MAKIVVIFGEGNVTTNDYERHQVLRVDEDRFFETIAERLPLLDQAAVNAWPLLILSAIGESSTTKGAYSVQQIMANFDPVLIVMSQASLDSSILYKRIWEAAVLFGVDTHLLNVDLLTT